MEARTYEQSFQGYEARVGALVGREALPGLLFENAARENTSTESGVCYQRASYEPLCTGYEARVEALVGREPLWGLLFEEAPGDGEWLLPLLPSWEDVTDMSVRAILEALLDIPWGVPATLRLGDPAVDPATDPAVDPALEDDAEPPSPMRLALLACRDPILDPCALGARDVARELPRELAALGAALPLRDPALESGAFLSDDLDSPVFSRLPPAIFFTRICSARNLRTLSPACALSLAMSIAVSPLSVRALGLVKSEPFFVMSWSSLSDPTSAPRCSGVHPCPRSWASFARHETSTPLSHSSSIIPVCFRLTAFCNGIRPLLVAAFTSAPRWMRYLTVWRDAKWQASCRGVTPVFVACFGFAPAFTSALIALRSAVRHATCSGPSPAAFTTFAFAPASRRKRRMLVSPEEAAAWRHVSPRWFATSGPALFSMRNCVTL
mmetsp:Transcript_4399/g.10083  ORF Transcript_4399/g.10083 Transcript_4399/m.10083 type:complete len:439 (-) Transcript_4399:61-1377(-)